MNKAIVVALALIVAGATFNSVRAQQPVTRVDSLSYAIGMAQTQGLRQYLSDQLQVNLNYTDDFVRGVREAVSKKDDERQAAYYAGTQIGQQIARQMYTGINKEIFGADSTQSISLDQFLAGFIK